MKKMLLISLVVVLIHSIAYAQRAKAGKDSVLVSTTSNKAKWVKAPEKPKPIIIPLPEYINQPYYYDKNDNLLVRLESNTAQMITKKKTLGLKGAKQFLTMDGASSKIRFTSKAGISFLIKTSGDVIDLTSYIKVYKFTSNDEKREVLITSKDGLINDKEEEKGKQVSISVKMISKDNY